MADGERIDVVVTDGVDPNVDKKLRAIAASADKGAASVLRLKAELAAITTTPVAKLQAAMETSTTTLNKSLAAQNGLTKATDAAAASDLKATSSKAKLIAEIDAETAARARLALAVDKGLANSAAANAPSAAFAAGKNPFQGVGVGGAALGGDAAALAASAKTAEAAVVEAEAVSVGKFASMKAAAMGAYDFMRDAFYTQANNFKGLFGASGVAKMGEETAAVENVGRAVGGSSLKIREFLVMGREASVGNWTRLAGSASILATAFGLLNAVLPVAIAGIAAFGLAKVSLNTDAEQKSLTDYAKSLGLTEKEMRKLKDTTVGASGALKSHNDLQIQFGDVFHGVVQSIKDGIASIGDYYGITTQDAKNFTTTAINYLKLFFENMVGGVYATAKFVYTTVNNLFVLAYDAGRVTGNAIYVMYATLANGVIALFNGVATIANGVSNAIGKGDVIQKMGYLDNSISRLGSGLKQMKGEDFFGDVRKGADAAAKAVHNVGENIKGAARERVKAEVDAIKANRNPKKASTRDPKTKADYLADENKKLDDQLSRMHLLKDAREEQQALDQIEEAFAKRKQTLTATEIAGFAAKIHAIQEYKYQQQEMDRIYDQFNGAQKIYSASLAASNDLLKRGAISAAQYALANAEAAKTLADAKGPADGLRGSYAALQVTLAQIKVWQENLSISQTEATERTNLANRAYQEATDKLLPLKEQMTAATIAAGLYGTAAKQNAYYQQILNSEFGKANNLSPEYVAGTNAKVDALMKLNAALLQAQQLQSNVQSTVSGIVDPIAQDQTFLQNKQTYYDTLNRMADQYNLKEQLRQQALGQLDLLYLKKRLAGASAFFTELSQLSQSKNKELAAIGKAAAVAQATIDGFVAVQAALKGPPGPPWSFAIAAATGVVAGANVARILSTNVGSFRDGGDFIVQGNAGVDNNNINFNASRGERVTVQTPAQQREAAKKGDGGPVNLGVKIINLQSKEEILTHMASDEGERVILNVLSDNPSLIRNLAGTKG